MPARNWLSVKSEAIAAESRGGRPSRRSDHRPRRVSMRMRNRSFRISK